MGRCSTKNGQILQPAVSPYFQQRRLIPVTKVAPEVGTGRIEKIILPKKMNAIVRGYTFDSTAISWIMFVSHYDGATELLNTIVTAEVGGITTNAGVKAALDAAVTADAVSHSYDVNGGIVYLFPVTVTPALANAPQAAIANAPADAVTNYNTVTTLLGAVTGAVNTANTKQNDIATKLNTLLAELRTLGLIAT